MSLELDRINFDTTDADTIAASANVGAFVRASDGTLITHTALGVGGVIKALDVNVANDITVALDGVYDGTDNLNPDNVGMIVHTRAAAPGDAEQTKRTTGASAASDAVVAANTHGIDVNSFLMGFNGTTWDRLRSYTNMELRTADLVNASMVMDAVVVDDTAGGIQLVASPLTSRKKILIQNIGKYAIAVGASGLTAADGLVVTPGSNLELPAGPTLDFYAICAIAGKSSDVRVAEFS